MAYQRKDIVEFQERLKADGRWFLADRQRREEMARLAKENPDWNQFKRRGLSWEWIMDRYGRAPAVTITGRPARPRPQPRPKAPPRPKLAASDLEEDGEPLEELDSSLLDAALATDPKSGGVVEDTEWVYRYLVIPWDRIDPDSVPSSGAVGLMKLAKQDPRWFLQTYHAKLLLKATRGESEGWAEADDGQIEAMVNRIREEQAEGSVIEEEVLV